VKLTAPTVEEVQGSEVLCAYMEKCAAVGRKHTPATVVLKKDKAHLFRGGHPMVGDCHSAALVGVCVFHAQAPSRKTRVRVWKAAKESRAKTGQQDWVLKCLRGR
jgi:hypothetical protein